MKKIAYNLILTSVLGLILLFFTNSINAQNINENKDEAVIYLRYSKNFTLNVAKGEMTKSPNDIYFLKNLVDKYQITVAEFPFASVNNDKLSRTFRIKFNNTESSNLLINDLKKIKELELVEAAPNYQTVVTSDDPYYNKIVTGSYNSSNLGNSNTSWHLNIIQAEQAWDITEGSASTIVAVLDNAFLSSHEDLVNKIDSKINLSDLQNINDNVEPIANTYQWGHGTQMAGIIAAESNNSVGIASIGRNIKLMAIKLGSDSNADFQSIVNVPEAIVYAVDNGAKVINISLATTQWSETLLQAVNYAINNSVVIVAAAGNDYSTNLYYPAAMPGVISVGSTDSDDLLSPFSNHGSWIDVYAPGGNSNQGYSGVGKFTILTCSANTPSTVADFVVGTTGAAASYTIDETGDAITGYYDLISGTSASAALTSGVCGLLLSINPDFTPEEIKSILKSSADLTSENILRINAFKAVQMASNYPTDTMLISFSANETAINIQDSVSFTIQTPNPIESNDVIEWSFESGFPAISNIENPTIKYFDRGRFDVKLKITKKDFENPIIDTVWKVVVDSIWARDSIWGTNPQTGDRELIRIDTVVFSRDTTWLSRIDTTYNILQENELTLKDLILVGKQTEFEADIQKAVLREQASNLPNGYKVTKIDPVTQDVVWAIATDETDYYLLRTNNYGNKWENTPINIGNLVSVSDISATSYDDIWLLCQIDTANIIYYSNDGATTWTEQAILDTLGTTVYNLNQLKMIDNNKGYATGSILDKGEGSTSNFVFGTEDAWANIDNAVSLGENEAVTSNLTYRNGNIIYGTNNGNINQINVTDGTTNSSLLATANSVIKSLSFADAKSSGEVITQGLAMVDIEDTIHVYKSTDLSSWEEMNTENMGTGLMKNIILHPTDLSLMDAATTAATEIVVIMEDTTQTPSPILLLYSRNSGSTWQIVDTNINYSSVALFDYHRGWFGADVSDFSSGMYKWFDVPEIFSNNVTLYERDTLGLIEDDFTRTPKQHYRVEIIDPDNHPTSFAPITSIAIFSFNYDSETDHSAGELSGIVTIAVTNPAGNQYISNVSANNGVRYSSKRDTIMIKTLRTPPVFIYENGDTINPLQIDTTITTHQAFEMTIKIIDSDYDVWNAPRGVTGENIAFYHDNSLPQESTFINNTEQRFSWLSFVDNGDHTLYYKTAKLFGVTEKTGNYQIKIRCSDGMYNNIAGSSAEYLYININVIAKPMDINENEIDNISLYPNPSSNYINVNNAEGLRYEIFNVIGKSVDSGTLSNSSIDIRSYNTGTYFIKIYDNEKVVVKKFIKN